MKKEELTLEHFKGQDVHKDFKGAYYFAFEMVNEKSKEYVAVYRLKEEDFYKYEFIKPWENNNCTIPVIKKKITLTEIIEYLKQCFERFKDTKSGETMWKFDENILEDINSLYNNFKKRDIVIEERLKNFNNKK